MSKITHTLRHTCTVQRLSETFVDGQATWTWEDTAVGLRCRLDTFFIKKGKDLNWNQEAGRVPERVGTFFVDLGADLRAGDRVKMTSGPSGTFELQGPWDEAIGLSTVEWLEISVAEVSQAPVT